MNDEDLEMLKTAHDYIDEMWVLSGEIYSAADGSACFELIDKLTEKLDHILVEMRHADWRVMIG